jgi:hypothetical protein
MLRASLKLPTQAMGSLIFRHSRELERCTLDLFLDITVRILKTEVLWDPLNHYLSQPTVMNKVLFSLV